jgi:hypothetical protein
MADNDDLATVAAAVAQFASPCLALKQLLVERTQRLRELGAQQFMRNFPTASAAVNP